MADEEFVDPLIGAKLGPCRVEERLAAGGMGVVYRARHTLLDQDVAVKILAPSLAADRSASPASSGKPGLPGRSTT
jgi:serine/threonine-protein kinase